MSANSKSLATTEVSRMFDRIAPRYDLLNRLMTFGLDRSWREATVKALAVTAPEAKILDLATGTGDLALAVFADPERRDWRVTAVDLSLEMMDLGRKTAARRHLAERIEFIQANAEALPFADESFDGATMGFGIRNVGDRNRALREICRVLRPGAQLAILEAAPPSRDWQNRLQKWHMKLGVRLLGRLFSDPTAYRYLGDSVAAFPPTGEFLRLLYDAGFHRSTARMLAFGAVTLFAAKKPKT